MPINAVSFRSDGLSERWGTLYSPTQPKAFRIKIYNNLMLVSPYQMHLASFFSIMNGEKGSTNLLFPFTIL